MKKEFFNFLNSKEITPPQKVVAAIYRHVEDNISFNVRKFIFKFFALNFSAGVLTLAICPQFGLGPFATEFDITHFFMGIGSWACAIFCATFYFTLSQGLSSLLLERKEIQWLKLNKFLVLPFLVTASFFGLWMLGSISHSNQTHMIIDTKFIVIWFFSGIAISQFIFYMFSRQKKQY